MKKLAGMIMTTLAICGLVAGMAFAKGKTHSHDISFNENTLVNGTMVKKSEYQARFNEETGELSIMDGKHIVATAKAREESLKKKAEQTSYDLHQSEQGPVLTQVTFEGNHYTLKLEMAGN